MTKIQVLLFQIGEHFIEKDNKTKEPRRKLGKAYKKIGESKKDFLSSVLKSHKLPEDDYAWCYILQEST